MENEKILELCDKKILLTKALESRLPEEDLDMVRELILVEKKLQEYVLRKDKEEIEVI